MVPIAGTWKKRGCMVPWGTSDKKLGAWFSCGHMVKKGGMVSMGTHGQKGGPLGHLDKNGVHGSHGVMWTKWGAWFLLSNLYGCIWTKKVAWFPLGQVDKNGEK